MDLDQKRNALRVQLETAINDLKNRPNLKVVKLLSDVELGIYTLLMPLGTLFWKRGLPSYSASMVLCSKSTVALTLSSLRTS
ncbi:TPA: hypothetical protein ACN30T_004780 [Vibrio parahaemolyticus]